MTREWKRYLTAAVCAIVAGQTWAQGATGHPGFTVLSYAPEYKNIQIVDGWAYEWGESEVKIKMSPEGPPVSLHTKGLRVLRRQGDGSWKIALNIWNQ